MSGTTTREPGTTRRAGDTLPRHDGPEPRRTRTALLSILGSLLLLVGVPVALVLGVGNPLPTEAPSAEWLTADVGPAARDQRPGRARLDRLGPLRRLLPHRVACPARRPHALARRHGWWLADAGPPARRRRPAAQRRCSIASGLSSLAADPADATGSAGPSVVQTVEQQVVLEQTPRGSERRSSRPRTSRPSTTTSARRRAATTTPSGTSRTAPWATPSAGRRSSSSTRTGCSPTDVAWSTPT